MPRQHPTEVKPDIETFAKIKVVGVGGAGGAALNRMMEHKISGIEFVAVNTDAQALHHNSAPTKIHIGKTTTRGLGAGMDPEVGRKAAEEDADEIREVLKDSDMVFVTGGLGGGTGTGAMPLVAEIARDLGALTVAVVTRPFSFEGAQRKQYADQGYSELVDQVDTIITIPNDRLLQIIDKKTSLLESFKVVDDVLRQGIQGIAEVITVPMLINVDFADVKTIMKDQGTALMGIGRGTGENRAVDAAKNAIDSPLLELPIDGAKGILFTVTAGTSVSMYEVNEAARIITQSADPNAKIIFGAVIDEALKDEMKVTVIATGFGKGGPKPIKKMTMPMAAPFETPASSMTAPTQKPTPQPMSAPAPTPKPTIQSRPAPATPSESDLEIPAFIRKKMM